MSFKIPINITEEYRDEILNYCKDKFDSNIQIINLIIVKLLDGFSASHQSTAMLEEKPKSLNSLTKFKEVEWYSMAAIVIVLVLAFVGSCSNLDG